LTLQYVPASFIFCLEFVYLVSLLSWYSCCCSASKLENICGLSGISAVDVQSVLAVHSTAPPLRESVLLFQDSHPYSLILFSSLCMCLFQLCFSGFRAI
jgi:hypothetical protein